MNLPKEVLSLDLEDSDLLYRIRKGSRIVYVQIFSPAIIPPEDRTESSAILRHLRSLSGWEGDWQTMTVTGLPEAPEYRLTSFPPHRLAPVDLKIDSKQWGDLNEIKIEDRISDSVWKVSCAGRCLVMKVARFQHELNYLRQELQGYYSLQLKGFTAIPAFYGYVYEENQSRVIGFLMEYLCGHPAGPADWEECRELLQGIRRIGFIHGDINRYNWLKTANGM